MLEYSIKFLTYEKAWFRADKLRNNLVLSNRPKQLVEKAAQLSTSFRKKSFEFKNKLIDNKQISKNY